MNDARSARPWAWLLLALAGLTALYAGPLTTHFLTDDYLFIEGAKTHPILDVLSSASGLVNYFRPLSRQIYFGALAPMAGPSPLLFHLVNYGLFLLGLALLADLLTALVPLPGVLAGVLYFALLPLQRVLLTWISCDQDLLALAGTLAAIALHRRGHTRLALIPALAAFASKESALPLPAVLAAWDMAIARRTGRETLRRVLPCALLAVAWAAVALRGSAPLAFHASWFAAAFAHLPQGLLGLEHPAGLGRALAANAPALLPLLAITPLLFATERPLPRTAPVAAGGSHDAEPGAAETRGAEWPAPAPTRRIGVFAAAWLAAFALVVGPVADSWSAYYYATAAAGGAILVALAMRRARAIALFGLLGGVLWLHAAGAGTRAFAIGRDPWVWTSHVTSHALDRAAALSDTISSQLREADPDPPADARMFFANLPPFAGFQHGNGAMLRALYGRPGIESYFYSEFSDSTAGQHPCRFYAWDGARLEPLARTGGDPFFQVGSDLLLLDRADGAVHAFHRGLAAGESPLDHLYWLGWAQLWRGRRDDAETAWTRLGFRDDSLRWIAHLRAAHNALTDGDSVDARRHLITAIEFGVGRPEAHAVLGELMAADHPKYALLELKVACGLDPLDWLARRELVRGLVRVRLDEAARREVAELGRIDPAWRTDSTVVNAVRELDARTEAPGDVVEF